MEAEKMTINLNLQIGGLEDFTQKLDAIKQKALELDQAVRELNEINLTLQHAD